MHRRHAREDRSATPPAEFVALPLFDGEIGIAPGHSPMIGRLGYGEMRITASGRTDRYYVEGGFVEVLDDIVSVLTPRAVPAAELDDAAVAGATRRRSQPTGPHARADGHPRPRRRPSPGPVSRRPPLGWVVVDRTRHAPRDGGVTRNAADTAAYLAPRGPCRMTA